MIGPSAPRGVGPQNLATMFDFATAPEHAAAPQLAPRPRGIDAVAPAAHDPEADAPRFIGFDRSRRCSASSRRCRPT